MMLLRPLRAPLNPSAVPVSDRVRVFLTLRRDEHAETDH